MIFCFQTFNHPSNVNNCFNKQRSHRQGKKNPSLLKLPSLIIQKYKNNDDPIILGVLNFNSGSEDDQENSPPPSLVLCSDPTLSSDLISDLLSVERKRCFAAKAESVVEKTRRKRMFLENSGVCCCIIGTMRLETEVVFQFKELKETKLRPIEAGSKIRIGVLDTNQNSVARFYQEKLENEIVLPDKATIEHILIPAIEALRRKELEGARNLFRIALQVLLVRAVNRVVLASDNIRQVLPPKDPLWAKCIDPMDALARSSIEYARVCR